MKDENAEDYLQKIEITDTQRIVSKAVEELPNREREVIRLYYFDNVTLADIGRLNGYSMENARRIKQDGLKKLRHNKQLRSLYITDYRERKTVTGFSRFRYSPEYFEAVRRLEELERQETQSIHYGRQQAQKRLIMINAEQAYKRADRQEDEVRQASVTDRNV